MALLTDRAANNKLAAARVASNVDVANPTALSNQLDQRHAMIPVVVVTTALTAATTFRYVGFVADRLIQVISARLIPVAAQTANSTNYANWSVVANNDAGGADTTLATLAVSTTSLVANQSTPLVVQATNTVAAGQQVDVLIFATGTGAATNAGTANAPYMLDIVYQEI